MRARRCARYCAGIEVVSRIKVDAGITGIEVGAGIEIISRIDAEEKPRPQQTAKNVFCLPSRTWTRKAVEAYYTFLIETFWDKRRIMEVYLNVIETGENMYGVEAPARQVYGKTAEHLNRHEASMIASVLPNPIRMKIAAPSSYVVRRAAQVRSLMSKLPPVDFDDPQPVVPARDRRK